MSEAQSTTGNVNVTEPSVTEILSKKGTVSVSGNQITFVADNLAEKIKQSSKQASEDESGQKSSGRSTPSTSGWSDIPSVDGDILDSLEYMALKLSTSLDEVIQNLTRKMHEASAITVGYSQTYSDAASTMGSETDEAIKSMYMLIAHCEELDLAMKPVRKVHQKIKHINTVLAALEAQIT